MELILQKQNLNAYLQDKEPAGFLSAAVQELIKKFSTDNKNTVEKARAVYEYVRDWFPHTFDIGANEVSVTAEDVIRNGHGICYAKSHLLAALMRGLGIPCGFCYQLLILDDEVRPYLIIHALNAIYITIKDGKSKWIRLDARGNKDGVDAQFSLNNEKLAFPIRPQLNEKDYEIIFAEPNVNVINALKTSKTAAQLIENLPREL